MLCCTGIFCLHRCCRYKRFRFSFSSPEHLANVNQTQHNVSRVKGIQVSSNKGHALFQGEILMKKRKCIDEVTTSSSPELLGHFQTNMTQGIRGLKVFISESFNSQKRDILPSQLRLLKNNYDFFAQICLICGTVFQVSNMVHGHFVTDVLILHVTHRLR